MLIGVDLGSTNMKAALYTDGMELIGREGLPVDYIRENGRIEFDAKLYAGNLVTLLGGLIKKGIESGRISPDEGGSMAFTGQAESLVILGRDDEPVMNAISWMDERSVEECAELAAKFSPEEIEAVTGQMTVLASQPATKILWLGKHNPEILAAAKTYMMLKDYIVWVLTGTAEADMSINTFTFYFDIYNKCYWHKMLDAIGIRESQLPPLAEPCTSAGPLKRSLTEALGLTKPLGVNIGTLDHFAGMIGTGNIRPGMITLSTGTVMALSTMCGEPTPKSCGMAMQYGFKPDSYVLLPVAESGGVSLEWFRHNFMADIDYRELDRIAAERRDEEVIFLPYIVGTNAPEFDGEATGTFWGLRQKHDAFDAARAVMEGVSFVLRRNCEDLANRGCAPEAIIATGGGAKSELWCQIQADITGIPVRVPKEKEAACLGAAMIAALDGGRCPSYEEAVRENVSFIREFLPASDGRYELKYRRFRELYKANVAAARME